MKNYFSPGQTLKVMITISEKKTMQSAASTTTANLLMILSSSTPILKTGCFVWLLHILSSSAIWNHIGNSKPLQPDTFASFFLARLHCVAVICKVQQIQCQLCTFQNLALFPTILARLLFSGALMMAEYGLGRLTFASLDASSQL